MTPRQLWRLSSTRHVTFRCAVHVTPPPRVSSSVTEIIHQDVHLGYGIEARVVSCGYGRDGCVAYRRREEQKAKAISSPRIPPTQRVGPTVTGI